jgi:hypothetical protein
MRPVNPFLNEIELFFDGTFIFDHYSKLHLYKTIDIIHIHWPEVLFDSKRPTSVQAEDFIEHFFKWKTNYKIVFTLHNLKPHVSKSVLYDKLYTTISNNVDVVVHFAKPSIEIFIAKYQESKASHVVIEHPLYLSTPNTISKLSARAYLKINKNKKVVLVFGQIRTKEEREFVFKTFKRLKLKQKFLLVTSLGKFRTKFNFGWKISNFVNKLMFKKYNSMSNYFIQNETIQDKDIQNYFNASDVVLIPRLNALNSGVLYLAYRFNKKVVVPNSGNMAEIALNLGQNIFNIKDTESAVSGLENSLTENKTSKTYLKALETMHPKLVAKKHEQLYKSL